jgi:hypothetical protein
MKLTLIGEVHPESMERLYKQALKQYEKKGVPLYASKFGANFLKYFEGVNPLMDINSPLMLAAAVIIGKEVIGGDKTEKLNDKEYVLGRLNEIKEKERDLIQRLGPEVVVFEAPLMKKRFEDIDVKKELLEGRLANFWGSVQVGYYEELKDNKKTKIFIEKCDKKFSKKLLETLNENEDVVCIVGHLHIPGMYAQVMKYIPGLECEAMLVPETLVRKCS